MPAKSSCCSMNKGCHISALFGATALVLLEFRHPPTSVNDVGMQLATWGFDLTRAALSGVEFSDSQFS